jgi:hypothetical protein
MLRGRSVKNGVPQLYRVQLDPLHSSLAHFVLSLSTLVDLFHHAVHSHRDDAHAATSKVGTHISSSEKEAYRTMLLATQYAYLLATPDYHLPVDTATYPGPPSTSPQPRRSPRRSMGTHLLREIHQPFWAPHW